MDMSAGKSLVYQLATGLEVDAQGLLMIGVVGTWCVWKPFNSWLSN